MKKEPISEVLNEMKAKAWNEAIGPRAESILSYMTADSWTQGIGAWLLSTREVFTEKLKYGSESRDDDQFLRGQLAMIDQLLNLPEVVKSFLDRKPSPKPGGSAGY